METAGHPFARVDFLRENTYVRFKSKFTVNTKLTLTIEKGTIEEAKKYAKEKGQSLSDLVENYFKLLTKDKIQIAPKELSSRTRKLRGILNVEDDFDYKSVLKEELSKKYGL